MRYAAAVNVEKNPHISLLSLAESASFQNGTVCDAAKWIALSSNPYERVIFSGVESEEELKMLEDKYMRQSSRSHDAATVREWKFNHIMNFQETNSEDTR